MGLEIRKIQAWSGEVSERPGEAAAKLELLARAGANLSFVFTRPHPTKSETLVIFLAPIVGPEQTRAAHHVGLAPASDVALLAVHGTNRPGMGYEMMANLAVAGIDLRGLSVSADGERFAASLAFDDHDVAAQAVRVLANLL